MTRGLVVFAPSAHEARWLSQGLDPRCVLRTGMGPGAAIRAAASPQARSATALSVAGIGGGVDPSLRAGDVVVASELRTPDRPVLRCRSAPLLAAAMRRTGLTVHVGPVASVGHIVPAWERRRLHAQGVLCVDMESGWLLERATTPVTAAVRVVADPAGAPLLRPVTLARVRAALQTLPLLGDALTSWAAAAAPRRVLLAGPRSFCAGVVRAIEAVERALDQRGAPVYVRKQIVHNSHVVRGLELRGAVFVDELCEVPDGASVIFSAHGVSPAVRAEAIARHLQVVDATCPLVTKVHSEVRRFADQGETVLFIGHQGHEESIGTIGERPGSTLLVQDEQDAAVVDVADPERVSYLVQTTLAMDEVGGIVAQLRSRFPTLQAPPSDDICYASTNRQRALQRVAVDSDLVLVVGSGNCSNANRLVESAERLGRPAHLVDDVSDIDLRWLLDVATVGLTAGASAPDTLVHEVVDALRGLGPVEVTDLPVITENVQFVVPKEVRSP